MARFCKNCGREIKNDPKFCPGCGKELKQTVQTEPTSAPEVQRVQESKNYKTVRQKKSKKSAAPFIIAAVVIGLAAVAVLAVVVISGVIIGISTSQNTGHNNGKKSNKTNGTAEKTVAKEADSELYVHSAYSWFYDEENDWMLKEDVEEEYVEPAKGNSSAFSIEPVDGIVIAAEENALDKNRDFQLTKVSDDVRQRLKDEYYEQAGGSGVMLGAWELDAGLKDDEMLPGVFTMTFDMDEFGLEEEDYRGFSVYRIDDEGKWYEYATKIDENKIVIESRQNSIITCFVSCIPVAEGFGAGAYYNPLTNCYDLYDGDKAVLQIMLDRMSINDDVKKSVEAEKKRIVEEAEKKALERMINEGYYIEKAEDIDTPSYRKAYMKIFKQEYKALLDSSPMKNRLTENKNGNKDIEIVGGHALRSWRFLRDELKVNMPTYKLRLELIPGKKGQAYGVSVTPPWLGNSYICVYMGMLEGGKKENYDIMLITLTHEMFHVVTREYVSKKRANYFFDELMAGDIETIAFEYYTKKGDVSTKKTDCLKEHSELGWFALPLDEMSTNYPEGKINGHGGVISPDGSLVASTAYPRGIFLGYLRKIPAFEDEYQFILYKYRFRWFADTTTLIKNNFSAVDNDSDLTKYWHGFAQENKALFYNEAQLISYDNDGQTEYTVFSPRLYLDEKEKQTVKLYNKDYTIRVRNVIIKKPKGKDYVKECALVLKYDDNFNEVMSKNNDFAITAIGNDENGENSLNWGDKGLFIEPKKYSNAGNVEFSLMEVDGGTQEKGFFGGSDGSGYSLYALKNPKAPETEVKDGTLYITLKDIRGEERAEVLDSYIIRLKYDGKDVYTRQVKLDEAVNAVKIAGEELELDGNKLSKEQKANLELTIWECVAGTYSNKKGLLGPGSEPVAVDLSQEEEKEAKEEKGGYWRLTDTRNSCDYYYDYFSIPIQKRVGSVSPYYKETISSAGEFNYQNGSSDSHGEINVKEDYNLKFSPMPGDKYYPGDEFEVDFRLDINKSDRGPDEVVPDGSLWIVEVFDQNTMEEGFSMKDVYDDIYIDHRVNASYDYFASLGCSKTAVVRFPEPQKYRDGKCALIYQHSHVGTAFIFEWVEP